MQKEKDVKREPGVVKRLRTQGVGAVSLVPVLRVELRQPLRGDVKRLGCIGGETVAVELPVGAVGIEPTFSCSKGRRLAIRPRAGELVGVIHARNITAPAAHWDTLPSSHSVGIPR